MQPWQLPAIIKHSGFLADSFRHWTGRELIDAAPEKLAEALYHAPFVLVSHDGKEDPVFNYANLTAQKLWKMDWETFTALPSRLSAEADAREARQKLLEQAEQYGYVDDYRGNRVTSDGRRFKIGECILWNVLDDTGAKIGQAATFNDWEWL